ncbi:MAG: DUF494 domain-containing protein [Proteobacteria bacterium]|nr:DUF494 domain-containing protein [Pseudomonadota bacterium]
MKDSLIQLLMDFFTKSLSELGDSKKVIQDDKDDTESEANLENQNVIIKHAKETSNRIFTEDERTKLTKASYQYLTQLLLAKVISTDSMEQVINQLLFSESRFVTVDETKWTVRHILSENLDAKQLAFLDLMLYQKEDKLELH